MDDLREQGKDKEMNSLVFSNCWQETWKNVSDEERKVYAERVEAARLAS